jgi:carboxylesterase
LGWKDAETGSILEPEDQIMIIPRGEPFYYPGNEVGCLLVHGFTGAPAEMRPLGSYLAEQGLTVLGVRLFGHATGIEDMTRSRWQDWAADLEDGWHLINGAAERIYLIGLSMGGVLSLYTASKFPFRGLVCLSTPLQISLGTRLENMDKLMEETPFAEKSGSDWHDPRAGLDHISYERYPLRGVIELLQLLKETSQVIPEIKLPTLLVQSRNDGLVPPENMPAIYDLLGTPEDQKEMFWVEDSGHVVTRDTAKERVFQAVFDFIQRQERVRA